MLQWNNTAKKAAVIAAAFVLTFSAINWFLQRHHRYTNVLCRSNIYGPASLQENCK